MEKLELKHLAPYLPYGLKGIWDDKITYELTVFDTFSLPIQGRDCVTFIKYNIKPILRPLSDLTKEIEYNGEKIVPIEWLLDNIDVDAEYDFISALEDDWASAEDKIIFAPLSIAQKLFEWHFDIFGLIEKGLAIDINTLD